MMLYLVSICTCAMAEDEVNYSYQGTAWGMTRDEVRMLAGVNVKRTRLARGIPMGSDLEFIDEVTMLRAFEGRVSL